jgi:putative ribosome biogenesis GTPase RsgA
MVKEKQEISRKPYIIIVMYRGNFTFPPHFIERSLVICQEKKVKEVSLLFYPINFYERRKKRDSPRFDSRKPQKKSLFFLF